MVLATPPFLQLESSRYDFPDWLPDDLRTFYTTYEGIGCEASIDFSVRLCQLAEALPVRLHDLHLLSHFPLEGGWDQFAGIRIGIGVFAPWGWGGISFGWRNHAIIVNNRPWERNWGNRGTYVHAYIAPRYQGGGHYVEHHEMHDFPERHGRGR